MEPAEEIAVNPAATSLNNPLETALEEQRQEHLQEIELLQQKLQEQERINAQQQQQLQQQQLISGIPGMPVMPGVQPAPQEPQPAYEAPQQSQIPAESAAVAKAESQESSVVPPAAIGQQQQPKFQLQPEVFAQIQALTG